MPLGALGLQALISRFSQDVVAIYTQDDGGAPLEQLVPDAHIMRASVNTQSKLFRHPLADGKTIIDHRIVLPVEIELAFILTDKKRPFQDVPSTFSLPSNNVLRNTYNVLLEYFNKGQLILIQTRTSDYPNMILQSIPHQETVEVFNGAVMVVRAQETRFAIPVVGVYSAADSTRNETEDRGELQPRAPTIPQQSAAAGILDGLTGTLDKFFGDA